MSFVQTVTHGGKTGWATYCTATGKLLGFQEVDHSDYTKKYRAGWPALRVDKDTWTYLEDIWNWGSESEKFNCHMAEKLYDLDLESFHDDSVGEAETTGYYALFRDHLSILAINSQGFVHAAHYPTETEMNEEWEGLSKECEAAEEFDYCD